MKLTKKRDVEVYIYFTLFLILWFSFELIFKIAILDLYTTTVSVVFPLMLLPFLVKILYKRDSKIDTIILLNRKDHFEIYLKRAFSLITILSITYSIFYAIGALPNSYNMSLFDLFTGLFYILINPFPAYNILLLISAILISKYVFNNKRFLIKCIIYIFIQLIIIYLGLRYNILLCYISSIIYFGITFSAIEKEFKKGINIK